MLNAPEQRILQNCARERIKPKSVRLLSLTLPLKGIVKLLPPAEQHYVLIRAKDLASKRAAITDLFRLLTVNQHTAVIQHALGLGRLEKLNPKIKFVAVTRLLTTSQQQAVVSLILRHATERNVKQMKVEGTIADVFFIVGCISER